MVPTSINVTATYTKELGKTHNLFITFDRTYNGKLYMGIGTTRFEAEDAEVIGNAIIEARKDFLSRFSFTGEKS